MANDFSPIYVGDTGAPFAPQFLHADNSPVNLTGATISMKMVDYDNPGNVVTCSNTGPAAWSIIDATNGKAQRTWQASDVATAASWWLFITITIGGQPLHADPQLLEIKYAP